MSIEEAIRIILETQKNNIKKKNILFTKEIDQSVLIYADEDLLNIALGNAIENAVKYSIPGGKVHISVVKKDSEKGNKSLIKIIIEDEGIGISEEELKMIENKEMFSTPGTMKEFGTGLGLLLSRDFITINQGSLQIRSKKGIGTAVTIELPSAREQIKKLK
jgi:signal transduction histidine kinase